jgi:hypothetical protein
VVRARISILRLIDLWNNAEVTFRKQCLTRDEKCDFSSTLINETTYILISKNLPDSLFPKRRHVFLPKKSTVQINTYICYRVSKTKCLESFAKIKVSRSLRILSDEMQVLKTFLIPPASLNLSPASQLKRLFIFACLACHCSSR